MLTLLVLLIGAAWVVGAVLVLVFWFWLAALALVALGLMVGLRKLTGSWPSGQAVALGAGLSLTLVLWVVSGGSKWVLIGGVIGTWLAGRAAALDDLDL